MHTGPAGELLIARNPNPNSRLPYILRLPVAGRSPIVLATAGPWPGARDLFCLELPELPRDIEIVDKVPVQACWQAGKAVYLVLRRRNRRRSMFVWTQSRGRTVVFWRTQKTMSAARPGLKVPQARRLETVLTVAVDVREQYPWRFARRPVCRQTRELPVGDYAVLVADEVYAAIERKSPAGLTNSAMDGTLSFVLAELSRLHRACLVVEGRFSELFKDNPYVNASWLMNVVAALQWTYPQVPWFFAETRSLAEEFAFRWLAAAHKAATDPGAPLYDSNHPGSAASARAGPDKQMALETGPGCGYTAPAVRDRRGRLDAALRLADAGRVWTTAGYAAHFDISQQTAWSDLTLLVKAGALRVEGNRRSRRYVRAAGSNAIPPNG